MANITIQQYEIAKGRLDVLLLETDDSTQKNDPKNIELIKVSDLIIHYESMHFPI